MRKIGKFILWVVILSAIFLAVYFAYQIWFGSPGIVSGLGKAKGIFLDKISTVSAFVKDKTSKTFENTRRAGFSYIQKGAGGAVSSIGEGLNSLGEQISGSTKNENIIESTSSITPIYTGTSTLESGFLSPSPFSTIAQKKGESISFSVNRKCNYEILWGDGSGDSGEVKGEEIKIISHIWSRQGDYNVIFEIESEGLEEKYTFPVRIYESR